MDWNLEIIIPLGAIAFGVLVLLIIVIRKFPDLVLVDVSTIPEERARELKDKLLADRLQRRASGVLGRFFGFFKKIFAFFAAVWKSIQDKVHQWEQRYRSRYRPVTKGRDMKETVKELIVEANRLLDNDEYNDAERAFLEVINVDKHNIDAYRGLGKLYYRQKEYQQSKEIYQFALKLMLEKKDAPDFEYENSDIAQLYYSLGLVFRALDAESLEFEYFSLAVENEENNPKYLDCLLEVAMKKKNKVVAEQVLDKLKEVNPNNSKLEDWAEQIKELPTSTDTTEVAAGAVQSEK